ncbi:lysophospholipid acyltransferase family protein [Chitinophaga horti]|uniref:Lysophospholipid acyltransferase family protein n=2 Tax=Chitinophaga horti TaxID=2920382 RepID=A0ABY6J8L4_9BACT|nr:lysophospholipid acyltransferase family protein [Chitinophaga horti]UYQ95983.1 lysophospholipid acyltransferase family protein [Chitinophaga horti]
MSFLYGLSSCTFFLVYHVFGYRKSVVIQNLARSFPEMKYGEIHCIVKKFYASFSDYFAEMINSISAPATIMDRKIVFDNLELLNEYLNAGQNVVVGLGHCGNWEMLNFLPYKLQHEVYAVYKPLGSQAMNKLMIRIRCRFGMRLLTDKSVVRHMLTQFSSPAAYLFLADQCPMIKDEKYRFILLHQPTYLSSGMEKLARITGSAVVYMHIAQLSRGCYKVSCLPICANAAAMAEGAVTRRYVDLLEGNIREEPYGWLWTHKRWKR